MKVGIYTNWYDWQQITGNSAAVSAADLWYWNVLGADTRGETQRDFGDFRSFSNFKSVPLAKQYGIGESVCGVVVNQDVFPASRLVAQEKDGIPIGQGVKFMVEYFV